MSGRIAIGVGCRKGCSADAIEALVRQAIDHVRAAGGRQLFTLGEKAGECGLVEAARRLGLDLIPLPRNALRDQAASVRTRSMLAERLFGVPSVAEAAALAGAGANAVLILPRIANREATCAVAEARS